MGLFDESSKSAVLTAGRYRQFESLGSLTDSNGIPTSSTSGVGVGDNDVISIQIMLAGSFVAAIDFHVWFYFSDPVGPASIAPAEGWCRAASFSTAAGINTVVELKAAGANRIYVELASGSGDTVDVFMAKAILP